MQPAVSRITEVDTQRVVVFGASGHAKVVLDILRLIGGVIIAGLLDDYKPLGSRCMGYEVIGGLRQLPAIVTEDRGAAVVVAVGDNWRRARIVEEIRSLSPHTQFASAVHPAAHVADDVRIGDGTVIMAGAVVNPGATIGEFCILNTRSSLDHDSTLSDYASLAPGATTGGGVRIGAYSNVGIGAMILPELNIGDHAVIGAGSVVTRSIPDRVVAYGSPARIIRPRQPGDRYLSDPAGAGLSKDGSSHV